MATNTHICPNCGHNNPLYRWTCEECGAQIVTLTPTIQPVMPMERPGCVTAYAVLNAVIGGLTGLYLMGAGVGTLGICIGVGVGGLSFVVAWGLWELKSWGRYLVLALLGLSILGRLLSLCTSSSDPYGVGNSGVIIGSILGILIAGYIFYWFYTHGEYFQS